MRLDENDYLTFQLYTASKATRVKRARLRSWILTTLTFACLAYLFYRSDNDFLTVYFLVFAGLSLFFFPLYSRWRYKKHYQKYVLDVYKDSLGQDIDLEFCNDNIVTKAKGGEVRINKSEVKEINEIKDFYFIYINTGSALIIPKKKADNLDEINREIKSMVDTLGAKHNVELDWKWT
jgi:hypothetical protein